MHILDKTFQSLKNANRTAFIPYITAGHPNLIKTEDLIYLLEKEGADIVEIGIPSSDPLADGPVIEKASLESIEKGTTIKSIFDCIIKTRENTNVPIVFLVYFNTILSFGINKFVESCIEAKVSGLVVPDLPYEEREELLPFLAKTDIALIPLITLTSKERIKNIVCNSKGFVYCVSSLGVTGIRRDFHKNIDSFIEEVRSYTSLPLALGFGISNADDIIRFNPLVDGIIVGSALVKKIEETNCDLDEIRKFIRDLTYPLSSQ